MEALHTENYKNHTISIYQDDFVESPREWENLGTIAALHREYNLADKIHAKDETRLGLLNTIASQLTELEARQVLLAFIKDTRPSSTDLKYWLGLYNSRKELLEGEELTDLSIDHFNSVLTYLNVYMYEHGSIALSTSNFSCPWDSGQLGFIYCLNSTALKESIDLDRLPEILKGEIEIYSQYLNGEVFGFIIEGPGCDNSCWGFYGSDYKDLLAEAKSSIDFAIDNTKEVFRSEFLQMTE